MKVQVRHQQSKKYKHDLSHDINTTSDFGFVQPILCRQLNAQDTVSLRFGQICRLQPLARPTFGQMKLKTYTNFVKAEDIWHAYGSWLAGQSYGGAINSYIPNYIPSVSCKSLYLLCMIFSNVRTFTYQTSEVVQNVDIFHGIAPLAGNLTAVHQAIVHDFTGWDITVNELYQFTSWCIDYFGTGSETLVPYIFNEDTSKGVDDVESADWIYEVEADGNRCIVYGWFNNLGRNLRKIFIGLGYQLNFDNTRVDALPLFAYWKAYFDTFVPQRDITWKDTNAFKIMEYAEQSGFNDFRALGTLNSNGHLMNFWFFILDLSTSYYTIPGDYASAHILGLGNDVVPQTSFNFVDRTDNVESVSNSDWGEPALSRFGVGIGTPGSEVNIDVTRSALRILNEMQKLSNLHSAVGGNIREFLRAVYNSDYNDDVDSAFIGSQIMDISPEPIFNTAETEQGTLGDFRGQALGTTSGKNLKFTAKSPGYVISFFAVVPEARMSQGVDPMLYHQVKEDIFNPAYDALTLLPTRKTAIYGIQEHNMPRGSLDGGFGNIPNYSEYKIKHNILNGDMSLPSTRSSYLPFTIDKLLPFSRRRVVNADSISLSPGVLPSALVAGTFWRFIGMRRWFGNFDRVFVNDNSSDISDVNPAFDFLQTYDDNFNIAMYADFVVTGYELPFSLSFDTGENDGDTMTVEKS